MRWSRRRLHPRWVIAVAVLVAFTTAACDDDEGPAPPSPSPTEARVVTLDEWASTVSPTSIEAAEEMEQWAAAQEAVTSEQISLDEYATRSGVHYINILGMLVTLTEVTPPPEPVLETHVLFVAALESFADGTKDSVDCVNANDESLCERAIARVDEGLDFMERANAEFANLDLAPAEAPESPT